MKLHVGTFITLAGILGLVQSAMALEIRRPSDVDYSFEIYSKSRDAQYTYICGATSFRDSVTGSPLYRATKINLREPVHNPVVYVIDTKDDKIIQKKEFSLPLTNDSIIELRENKKGKGKKITYEIVVLSAQVEQPRAVTMLEPHNGSASAPYDQREITARLNAMKDEKKKQLLRQKFDELDQLMAEIEALSTNKK